ncbi:MAG: KPN_02809 family neutral zinc metallopeptidase, partial [Dongiaceae bacterium]
RRSENIEDRRGTSMRGLGGGFGGGLRPGVRRVGIGGFGLIVVVVLALLFGIDPSELLQGGGQMRFDETGYSQPSVPSVPSDVSDELRDFVAAVLGDTEQTWNDQFRQMGNRYQEPNLVLFDGAVQSACGYAQSAVGPFYCPNDRKVYLDLGFFYELQQRFSAPGDFAQAYVMAHEVGHHVQNLLGILPKVSELREQVSESEGNALSVMLELQADCLAGVWANRAQVERQVLEQGDIEEALNAATAIGDDRLQRESQGYIVPDAFTHGSSAQRVRWFQRGLDGGDINGCDTFNADRL